MKHILIAIIFAITFSSNSNAIQNFPNLTNIKTNQWLHYSKSTFGKTNYDFFKLYSKSDSVVFQEIKIVSDTSASFIDSLLSNGWNKSKISTCKGFKNSIELSSCTFLGFENSDSLYQFEYTIKLTNEIQTFQKHLKPKLLVPKNKKLLMP